MDDKLIARIGKILPMLSSDKEGEVVNAANAITKILKEANLHWADVVHRLNAKIDAQKNGGFKRPPPQQPQPQAPRRQRSAWADDRDDVEKAYPYINDLDTWSGEFLESIRDQVLFQGRTLSDRQRSKLNEILDKVGA